MAEVIREIIYHQGEPVLVIKPKVPRGNPTNFAIRMQDLWQYTPDKNPEFEKHMLRVCGTVHELLDLGVVTSRKMAEVATVIEDGIEDLLAAPLEEPAGPPDKMRRAMAAAIRNAEVDGNKVKFVVRN